MTGWRMHVSGLASGASMQSITQLCSTWGPMEEHAARGADVEALKQLGVDKGQEDHLLQLRHVAVQAAHLVEGDAGVHLQGRILSTVSSTSCMTSRLAAAGAAVRP